MSVAAAFRRAFRRALLWALCGLAISGCGGSPYTIVPVSGKITLDGQPVAEARVGFEPIRRPDQINVGPGSYALTDELGHFSLETLDGKSGAVIGPHRVYLSTSVSPADRSSESIGKSTPERIPRHYLDGTIQLEFTVPPEGIDAANFTLSSEAP